jgi:hypothetical protein
VTSTTVESAVSSFGERTKGKLANVGASGQPEDQLVAYHHAENELLARLYQPRGADAAPSRSGRELLKIQAV